MGQQGSAPPQFRHALPERERFSPARNPDEAAWPASQVSTAEDSRLSRTAANPPKMPQLCEASLGITGERKLRRGDFRSIVSTFKGHDRGCPKRCECPPRESSTK